MNRFDFCLAWNWEYDADFVDLLGKACQTHGLTLLQVTPVSLASVLESLDRGEVAFAAFLDRASEADPRFLPLLEWAKEHEVHRLNPYERAAHAMNKASMHLEFITAGIRTPYTIILPPYNEQPTIPPPDLGLLGERFTIKPAHGGGGEGVVVEARSLSQVLQARQEFPKDFYLLQAHIVPAALAERPAWFRVLYCGGRIYPCWWDISTHVYLPETADEESRFGLAQLQPITQTIAGVCELDCFSTEIALTAAGFFVVVDYVNDQIDLRLKSRAHDGVPDEIAASIADRLAELVLEQRSRELT
jgi:hypothetical protein